MGPFRAVLFDAAGTLIRLREPVGETYARLAARFGVELPASRIEEAFRRVFRCAPAMVWPRESSARTAERERAWWCDVVRACFRAADGTVRFTQFDAYFDVLFGHFARPAAWELTPGAIEALRGLRAAGLRTAVVSNFDHRLPALLEGLGLSPHLEAVVRPGTAGAAKPDPRIFSVALGLLGLTPGEAVYVGDDAPQDRAGARAAGLAAVDVASLATLTELAVRLRTLSEEKRA